MSAAKAQKSGSQKLVPVSKGGILATTAEIIDIPFSRLIVDRAWNVRKSIGDEVEGAEGDIEHSFKDLKNSLAAKGQDIPITVRRKGEKFFVVVGFRRTAALEQLYKEKQDVPGLPPGHIRAIVKDLTDEQARSENMRENCARENLTVADKAWGFYQMHRPKSEGGSDLSGNAIAQEIGVNQTYVSKMLRIVKTCSAIKATIKKKENNLFDDWRENPVLSINEMEAVVKAAEKNEGDKKYLELLANKSTNGSSPSSLPSAIQRGEQYGTVLGRLVRRELISLETEDFVKLIEGGKPFAFGSDLTEAQKKEVAKRALVRFKAIRDGEEEKKEAEKAAAKAAKEKAAEEAKAAKASKGKEATA